MSGVGISGDSIARRDKEIDNEFDDEIEDVVDNEIGKKDRNLSKSKNLSIFKKTKSGFFISGAKIAFIQLRQAFIKVLILHHVDPKHHIQIQTNALGYSIHKVPSQLTLDNLGQWHPHREILCRPDLNG